MLELDCTVKRYFNIFLVKPKFLLILIVVPMIFYLYTISRPVAYEISNTLGYSAETVLHLPNSGMPGIYRDVLLEDPAILFIDPTMLAELNHLITRGWNEPEESGATLTAAIINTMSLVPLGNEEVEVTYNGPQQATGSLMVYFYSRKLIAHSRVMAGSGNSSSLEGTAAAALGNFGRNLEVRKIYRLWDHRRLYPLGVIFVLSFAGMLLSVAIAEWLDSSLKSEQQAASYLDLPVLGSFPDFEELGALLAGKAEDANQGGEEKDSRFPSASL